MRTVNSGCVILDSTVWREELAGELERLGFSAEQADAGAVKALQHVCSRAGWPREVFRVDHQSPSDEETVALMTPGSEDGAAKTGAALDSGPAQSEANR
jgi:hypothetical protein